MSLVGYSGKNHPQQVQARGALPEDTMPDFKLWSEIGQDDSIYAEQPCLRHLCTALLDNNRVECRNPLPCPAHPANDGTPSPF